MDVKTVAASEGCRSSVASLRWTGAIMAENSASIVVQISSIWMQWSGGAIVRAFRLKSLSCERGNLLLQSVSQSVSLAISSFSNFISFLLFSLEVLSSSLSADIS